MSGEGEHSARLEGGSGRGPGWWAWSVGKFILVGFGFAVAGVVLGEWGVAAFGGALMLVASGLTWAVHRWEVRTGRRDEQHARARERREWFERQAPATKALIVAGLAALLAGAAALRLLT